MSSSRMVSIDEVVDLLNLEKDPKSREGADSYNVRCPFCGGRKYKMNINSAKNVYHCVKCSGNDTNTGVLDLYGRVRLGVRLVPGPGGNGSYLSSKLNAELEGIPASKVYSRTSAVIEPADDLHLNAAYSALLSLNYLNLSDEHRKNLLERGLDETSIAGNLYHTMPNPIELALRHEKYLTAKAMFRDRGLDIEMLKHSRTADTAETVLAAGMLIANDLIGQGIDLHGVPGFYKLRGTWFFNITQGMLIPTRNMSSQIVGLQVRRDKAEHGSPRYMTVSSKGLPAGVDVNISRTHFPLGNAELGSHPDMPVILTEGPLKADISSHLFGGPSYFIAVQGVNSTRELPEIAQYLKSEGIGRVYSAFDMDKTMNPYVARAGCRAREIFSKEGISLVPMLWDTASADRYQIRLKNLLMRNRCEWKETGNSFTNIAKNVQTLVPGIMDYDRLRELLPWSGLKGIDDFLLSLSSKGAVQ